MPVVVTPTVALLMDASTAPRLVCGFTEVLVPVTEGAKAPLTAVSAACAPVAIRTIATAEPMLLSAGLRAAPLRILRAFMS